MKSLQTEKGMQYSYENPIQYKQIVDHGIRAAGCIILLLLICVCGWESHASADCADIKITTKQQVVSKGDTVYVMVTVTSTTAMSGFEGFFTYDNTVLQFQTGGSVVYGNDDAFQISDIDRSSTATKLKYSIKFKARKAGDTEIALTGPYHVFGESTSTKLSASYNSLVLVVKDREKATAKEPSVAKKPVQSARPKKPRGSKTPSRSARSKENNKTNAAKGNKKTSTINDRALLKSLEIEGVTLSPAFAEQTSDYTAVIQEEKEWLNVIYETEQKGLQVEITGNKNLQKGKNMIKLIVKNADGAQSVYQVEVTVQPEQETMAPESGQDVPPGDQLAGNATAKPQVDASEEEMRIEKQRMQYIVGIMAAFCGLLILGIISLIRRYRSQNLK